MTTRFPIVGGSNLAQRVYVLPDDFEAELFIDEGMRRGIRHQPTRARTITLYTDKQQFRTALGLPHEDHISVLLVDRQGHVLWQTEGAYRPDAARALTSTINLQMAVA